MIKLVFIDNFFLRDKKCNVIVDKMMNEVKYDFDIFWGSFINRNFINNGNFEFVMWGCLMLGLML